MNKLYKIITVIALMIAIISISLSVNAYTNNDVIAYISKAHTVNGRTVQLTNAQRQSLKSYLESNPVTNTEADQIISKLEGAKTTLAQTGATGLSQLTESQKAQVMSLVKEAGKIAGLDVEIDTKSETVTIKDSKGNVIVSATSYSELNVGSSTSTTGGSNSNGASTSSSSRKKLVYTGNSYSVSMKLIAVVAIAIAGIVVKNKYAK